VLGFFAGRPARQLQRFRERFTGRALILHDGFPADWLEELLRQPGGGGHFRLDIRPLPAARPTPVEWLVQAHILPLDLPRPILVQVRERDLLVRHLQRRGIVVHPSEIAWFLEELDTRYHARLLLAGTPERISVERGMAVDENEALSMLEHLAG
jgi:hypothetical protein